MSKLIRVLIFFISLASIVSCGGGSSSNSDLTDTESSNWDEMNWGQGSWK